MYLKPTLWVIEASPILKIITKIHVFRGDSLSSSHFSLTHSLIHSVTFFHFLQYQHNPSSNSSTLSFTTTPTQTVPISATSETTTAITPSSTPTTTTVDSCYRMQMEEYLDATAYGWNSNKLSPLLEEVSLYSTGSSGRVAPLSSGH